MKQVEGLSGILKSLNKAVTDIEKKSMGGLLAAGQMILGEAKKPVNVPIQYGNLRNSGYVQKGQDGHFVEIGFGASYAIFVHENLEAFHKKGRAKFLEIPLNENKEKAFEIIRRAGQIK